MGRRVLDKLIPPACPHLLGKWVLRTGKSTTTYPDGAERPVQHRGGRTVVMVSQCISARGHDEQHRTADGRRW